MTQLRQRDACSRNVLKCLGYCIKQLDSILPWVCTLITHRGRQNVVRTSVTLHHVLTSSVRYHSTDARQNGIYSTNRFQVAVRLFSNRSQMTSKCGKNKKVAHEPQASVSLSSNRSQMTSKCGKNKKVAHEPQASVSLMFLPQFDVFCDLLLNRSTATWNLFVLYNEQKGNTTHLPLSA